MRFFFCFVLFSRAGGHVRDLSAKFKLKEKTKKNQLKKFEEKKKKTVHLTKFLKLKDDLNLNWRAICDRRLSCPTLLSPIILFPF